MTRLIALVGPLTGVRHAVETGTHTHDAAQMLPVADVLLIASDVTGAAMMFRYTAHGDFAGDTLHETIGDAKIAAEAEYEEALMPWEDVIPTG